MEKFEKKIFPVVNVLKLLKSKKQKLLDLTEKESCKVKKEGNDPVRFLPAEIPIWLSWQ